MANKRIKDLGTTASTLAADDYVAIDGNANGTRKIVKGDLVNDISTQVAGTYLDEANNLSDVASKDTSKLNLEVPDVGTAPNEVPLNGQLGTMAFQSAEAVSADKLEVESTTGTATTQALTVTDGTDTKFVVQEDGKTGIGTDSPGGKLTIETGSGNGLQLYRSASNANFDAITFRDTTNTGTNARVGFNVNELRLEGTTKIGFNTNGSQRAVIDSSGGITQTVPNPSTLGSGSRGFKVSDGTQNTQLLRTGSGYNYGGVVGTGSMLYSYDSIRYLADTNQPHQFCTGGSERVRIDTDGLKFNGDTAAANALNDYEEGTWTPALSTGTGESITYASQDGDYTRIGNLVHCTGRIQISSAATYGSANHLQIGGLPFTAENSSRGISFSYGGGYGNNSLFQVGDITGAQPASNGASSFYLQRGQYGGTSDVYYRVALLNTTGYLLFSLTYETAQ